MNKNLTFEFMYADTWYKYENSWIYRQNIYGDYVKHCPVLPDLVRKLEDLYTDQQHTIMEAILYGFCHGKLAGSADKVKEIKRVLCIEERSGI